MLLITEDKDRIQYLIEILRGYAYMQHGHEQEAMDTINKMVKNNATVKEYVMTLADGLLYGNWPWTTYK